MATEQRFIVTNQDAQGITHVDKFWVFDRRKLNWVAGPFSDVHIAHNKRKKLTVEWIYRNAPGSDKND